VGLAQTRRLPFLIFRPFARRVTLNDTVAASLRVKVTRVPTGARLFLAIALGPLDAAAKAVRERPSCARAAVAGGPLGVSGTHAGPQTWNCRSSG
jgi:hypothetical protein